MVCEEVASELIRLGGGLDGNCNNYYCWSLVNLCMAEKVTKNKRNSIFLNMVIFLQSYILNDEGCTPSITPSGGLKLEACETVTSDL